ncbi:unnamed protein product [Heligmosomoides polygyrus]|uniref:S1 motif domain-containing protein n=1 Tax=Heligmosomoides polygyrus TaxID=6339 RepID=A0A3P8HI23_HELPZ|nr:unnamed protein product [Heligmosomoides polygyrus]
MSSKFLVDSLFPLEEFIKRNHKKNVVVKIMNFVSIKKGGSTVRVAELTMADAKMAESRKKASAVAFTTEFKTGDSVRCFVIPNQEMTAKNIRVEVNPLWCGQIAHEAISDDMKVQGPEHDGEVFESLPKGGEMRLAKVIGVVKMKKKNHGVGVLNLSFDLQANTRMFQPGKRVTGRVTEVSRHPLWVKFHLPSGQQATLCATAIASNYDKVEQLITHFKQDCIFHLYALRQDQNPQRNYVCAEGRYEAYLKQKDQPTAAENPRRLLADRNDVLVDMTCDGFVAKHTPGAILVEIGPGIIGRIRKLHHPEITTVPLNSIVSVKVRQIDSENRISLSLVRIVSQVAPSQERKRPAAAVESTPVAVKKEKKQEVTSEPAEKVELSDPGFDWSNAGFRPEDLAAVGKLGDDDVASPVGKATTADMKSEKPTESKKERMKDLKTMTKEEQIMEKERRLVNREVELSGDFEPETQEDFARLLKKDPNSAEIWIRYITFFLEKNDLTKARATAERALTVINYR